MKDVRVIGVGNRILSDDGIGSLLSGELMKREWPAGVQVMDAGCALSDMILRQEGADHILLIDAVKGGGNPGDVYKFDVTELEGSVKTPEHYTSVHEIGLVDSIALARVAFDEMPKITVIGIEPDKIETGLELSDTLKNKWDAILDFLEKEIRELAEED